MNKQIIVGFEFENKHIYQEAINIAKFHFDEENEDFEYCVARERGKEILTCQEHNFPHIVFLKNNEFILYTNVDINNINIKDYQLFLRTRFKNKSHYFGIERIKEKEDNIIYWPNYINDKNKFCRRNLSIVTNRAFNKMLSEKTINPPFFIKTVHKSKVDSLTLHHPILDQKDLDNVFGELNSVDYLKDESGNIPFNIISPDWYCPYREMTIKGSVYKRSTDDDFIISDVIDIKKEYRCYIIHNQVSSISEYNDYISTQIPEKIFKFANDFVKDQTGGNLPSHYVLDIAELTSSDLVVVELNNISNSGRYFDNDPYKLYQDLFF